MNFKFSTAMLKVLLRYMLHLQTDEGIGTSKLEPMSLDQDRDFSSRKVLREMHKFLLETFFTLLELIQIRIQQVASATLPLKAHFRVIL